APRRGGGSGSAAELGVATERAVLHDAADLLREPGRSGGGPAELQFVAQLVGRLGRLGHVAQRGRGTRTGVAGPLLGTGQAPGLLGGGRLLGDRLDEVTDRTFDGTGQVLPADLRLPA